MKATNHRLLFSSWILAGLASVSFGQTTDPTSSTDPNATSQSRTVITQSPSPSDSYGHQNNLALDMNGAPRILVDNRELTFGDVRPGLLNGQLMIPLRAFAEQHGATITWDNESKVATVTPPTQTSIQFAALPSINAWMSDGGVGRAERFHGNSVQGEATRAVIIHNRVYVPMEQLATAFNGHANWDRTGGDATFTFQPNPNQPNGSDMPNQDPNQPATPGTPVPPVTPDAPSTPPPANPNLGNPTPGTPVNPGDPGTSTPAAPGTPGTPDTPQPPTTPGTPVTPTPGTPGTPSGPGTPDQPVAPGDPNAPAPPANPSSTTPSATESTPSQTTPSQGEPGSGAVSPQP